MRHQIFLFIFSRTYLEGTLDNFLVCTCVSLLTFYLALIRVILEIMVHNDIKTVDLQGEFCSVYE